MPQGLPRKIRLAFIVQALIASLVMVLGVVSTATLVRQKLVRDRLREEAAVAWQQIERGEVGHLAATTRVHAYFQPTGSSARPPVPDAPLGIHVPVWQPGATLVERREAGTLTVLFAPTTVDSAIFWTAGVCLLLALFATYLSSWLTYRTSRQMVAPVSWLAAQVARWDPRTPDVVALAPHKLPVDSGSEVRRLASALRDLAGRMGEYVDRERHFTRDASHELRTPLTVIRVASDMMAGDVELPPRSQRAVARIQRAGHDMESVIDAFLILARDAELDAEVERFDLHEVVDDEVEAIRPALGDKPVELIVTDDGGGVVDAPRRALSLIIGNLLSNAVRFTETGRVDVVLAPGRIEIRDTGVGMSPEALAKAFDAFYREDRDGAGGMGIGLSIVRRLSERFGWPVDLASTPGRGTVAVVRLTR